MNIELANGSEGYIPPPEQHALGGYTTWPARTAALEVQAEPKIVATVLGLLEQVAGPAAARSSPRDKPPYAEHVLAARPLAYWRLDEMAGPSALDATGHEHDAAVRGWRRLLPAGSGPGGLEGREADQPGSPPRGRPARVGSDGPVGIVHRRALVLERPAERRAAGHRLPLRSLLRGKPAETLGLGGSSGAAGRLFLSRGGPAPRLSGKTEISPRTWHHLVLTRTGGRLAVHLDGNPEPEITAEFAPDAGAGPAP